MGAPAKRKPTMPAAHRERAKLAKAKLGDSWTAPGFTVERSDLDAYDFDCPFRDEDREHWQWLVAEAVGTRNLSVVRYSLNALSALCAKHWSDKGEDCGPELTELNTALAICAACEPENEAQAAIAMQMVGLHFSGMKLADKAGRYGADERTAATQVRVAKGVASLARTLAQLQGKLQPRAINQTIQVIYTDNRDQRQQMVGGVPDFGGQSHANSKEIPLVAQPSTDVGRAALPSPCSDNGATVLLAGRQGQASVPDAWWWQRLGRALWRS